MDDVSETTLIERRIELQATGQVNRAGRFEILAITAGEGNGWHFSAETLQESVPLWDGVECFVDHASWFNGRSLRDLGGVCRSARWSPEYYGVMLDLETVGPSAGLVDELGRQLIAMESPPKVGFSADLVFTAKGQEVQKILRIYELCLVFDPARGGAFVRALNSAQGNPGNQGGTRIMTESVNAAPAVQPDPSPPAGDGGLLAKGQGNPGTTLARQLNQDLAAVKSLLTVQQEREALAREAEEARKVRAQMCAYLLESGLSAVKLPQAMAEHVRKQFENRVFDAAELDQAIEDARALVSNLLGGSVVQGPRVSGMFTTEDQLQAAVDDLLNAPRDPDKESLKVHRLSGIKELYLMLTGDRGFYGGYFPDRVQLATTATMTGLVTNSLNKIVAQQWYELGAAGYDWWMRITTQEHFETLNTVTGVLVGTVGTLPVISEGAEYTELKIGDSPETATFYKYGGYIPLTLELIDRDNTRKLAMYPREMAKAALRRISGLVAGVFSDNSGVGPTMADTGALFNATTVTTAGGHANLLTTALSASEWEVVCNAVYSQPMLVSDETGNIGVGPALAIDPRYLVVPRELRLTAMKILYPEWENTAQIYSENLQRGQAGDVVVVPEWTDANNWAAVVDPRLVPGIVVCERFGLQPEIFIAGDELSPAVFMNDEHRIKVRHFVAVLVQDYRPLHKSNVA